MFGSFSFVQAGKRGGGGAWAATFETQSSSGTSATHATGVKLMPSSIDTVKPSDYHTVDVTTSSLEFLPSNALHKHRGASVHGSTRASVAAPGQPVMSPISSAQSGGTHAQFHSHGTSGSGGGSYGRHQPSSQESALAAAAAAAAARRPPPGPASGGSSSASGGAAPARGAVMPQPAAAGGRGGAMLPMAPPPGPPAAAFSSSRPVDFSYRGDTVGAGDTVGSSVDFGVSAYQRYHGNTGGAVTNVGTHAASSAGGARAPAPHPSPRSNAQRPAVPSRPSGSSLSDPPTPPLTVRTPEGVITSFPRKTLERVRSRLDRADTTVPGGVPNTVSGDTGAKGGSSGGSDPAARGSVGTVASAAGSGAPGVDTPDGGAGGQEPPPADARIEDLILWLNMQLDQIAEMGENFIFMRKYRLLGPGDRRQGGAPAAPRHQRFACMIYPSGRVHASPSQPTTHLVQ